MFSASTQTAGKSGFRLEPRSLRCEHLEKRELMTTTYMVLDFTPDSHQGSFVDTFLTTRLPNSKYSPNFLDFNGDHWVNATDAQIAAQRVANRVAGFYSQAARGFDVQVKWGDVTKNTNWGTQWVNYGKYYSNVEAAVMYFGGTNKGGSNVLGMAPQARDGYNFEGYGETYTRTIANLMAKWTPNASPNDFVEVVARTAAHELGHMFGLRHIQAYNLSNVMNTATPIPPQPGSFVNQWLSTIGGAVQNAYQELRNSFYGQTQENWQPSLGGQYAKADLPAPAGPVDQAIANLMGDGGAVTLDGAQATAEAAAAVVAAGAGQHRTDLAGGVEQDIAPRRLFAEALAGRRWQPTRAANDEALPPSPALNASAGQGLQASARTLRRAKDQCFGSRSLDRDVLGRELEVSRQLELAASLA